MENLDTFLLALICFIMGATLVGLVVYLRGGTGKKTTGEKSADPDLVEVARLWRSRKTNRMIVWMDEKNHTSAREMSAEQLERLSGAVSTLQIWLAEGEPGKATPPAAPAVPPVVSPTPPAAGIEQANAAPASPAAGVRPVQARPLDALNRVFTSGPAQAAPKFKSIAAQINEMLQSRLPGSPFETVGIHLIETADQGVIVRVGEEEFNGVEAVPDPVVRAFIKAAVVAWEEKTRGGIR